MSKLPQERQSLMFSATFPASIEKLASKHLKSPERVSVGSVVSPISNIKQEIVKVSEGDKYAKLLSELESREGSVIIFVKTKMATERLAEKLQNDHQTAIAIHGDLKQQKRERVINIFRRGGARVMVATDVVARGLDIPHIQHVVNYDLPQCPEDYIHRIGRTARAGATGHSLCLITPQDSKKWNIIQKFMDPEASVSGKAFEESRQGSSKSHRGRSNDRKPGDYQGRGGRSEGGFAERRSNPGRDDQGRGGRSEGGFGERRSSQGRDDQGRGGRSEGGFGERRSSQGRDDQGRGGRSEGGFGERRSSQGRDDQGRGGRSDNFGNRKSDDNGFGKPGFKSQNSTHNTFKRAEGKSFSDRKGRSF
jgi:superfamily II DNA/RNA helicase